MFGLLPVLLWYVLRCYKMFEALVFGIVMIIISVCFVIHLYNKNVHVHHYDRKQ